MRLGTPQLGLPGPLRALGVAGPTTLTDTFTRADNAASLGTADTGQAWTANAGTWGIASNRAYNPSGTDGDLATIDFGQSDMVTQVTLSTVINNMGIVARATDSNNFYLYDVAAGNSILYKRVAGSFTSLGSYAFSRVDGDVVKLSVQGSAIKAFVNGVERISATDTSLTTGTRAGIRRGLTGATGRFDNLQVSAT